MFMDAPMSVNNWGNFFSVLNDHSDLRVIPRNPWAKVPGSVVSAHRNLGLPSRVYRPCLGLAVELAKLSITELGTDL